MKVGVIGLGGMGRSHAKTVGKLDMVEAVLGCDLMDAAREKAKAEGLPAVADVPALLAWKPDAVIVATQPAAHAAAIEACFQAGVPVLTEKPLACTLAESRRLLALARRRRLAFQVGFELRYCGYVRAMRDVLKSGKIGDLLNANYIQISGSHGAGRMTRERCGGLFYEKLCHQVDLFRYLLGEPDRIMAVAGPTALTHYGIPDNVQACLVFPGGRVGAISFSCNRAAQVGGTEDHGDRGHFLEFTLVCTGGAVSFDVWTEMLSVVRFNHRADCKSELVERFSVEARYPEVPATYNIKDQDADFLLRVRDGREPQFPATDAFVSMQWVERAERSLAAGGRWIRTGR